MSSTFTKNFRVSLARQVQELTDIGANAYLPTEKQNYVYAVIGRQLPWNAGVEVAPTPGLTDNDINNYHKRAVFARLMTFENTSLVVPKITWTSNTVYNTYESTTNFYVVNSKDQVFKCLSNVATNTISTAEPQLTLSTTSLEEPYLQTADSYKWKYMYTISSVQKQKFMDENWMPVTYNKFVRAAAQSLSIDVVQVTQSGNNYTDGATQDIITLEGDGTGAILKANVVGGLVRNVVIQNRGTGYTYGNITFNDIGGGTGAGAAAVIKIAPHDGHGYDPVYELGATNCMFNVDFVGLESDSFPVENDFREILILQNPYEQGNSNLATGDKYTFYTKIKTSPGLGDFGNDEKVYQGTTYATSTFRADVISFDEVQNFVYVNNIEGTLQNNQALKGLQTGSIRVATSTTVPSIHLYTGKVLYISDRLPVSRDSAQTDRIRFILSF
jgi:hypothetical protein